MLGVGTIDKKGLSETSFKRMRVSDKAGICIETVEYTILRLSSKRLNHPFPNTVNVLMEFARLGTGNMDGITSD